MSGLNTYTFAVPYVLEYKIYRDNPGRHIDGTLDNNENDPRIQNGELLVHEHKVTVKEKSREDAIQRIREKVAEEPVLSRGEVEELISLPEDDHEWFLDEKSIRWITGNEELLHEEEN